jgi:arsenate reductase (thioredoxin)
MNRKRVLFICIGNACRSQMAEAFARVYGRDVMESFSAGLMPGIDIPPQTRMVMLEKGIDLGDQFPKPVTNIDLGRFDVVVNMSGYPLTEVPPVKRRDWDVPDPVGAKDDVHRKVRDMVEGLVMGLVLELRKSGARI